MIRKIVSIFFLLLTVYKSGYSYVNVYPYRVYLDSEKNKNEETIVLYNKTVLPLRYKLSIKDKRLKKVVSFYPQVITLNPGDEKEIKLKLENNRESLEKKEYRAEILIEQLKVPLKDEKGKFIKSSGVEVYPKVKIPLKLYLGEALIRLRAKENRVVNISEREINIEIFMNNKKSNKKNGLDFIKSVTLKDLEELDLEKEFGIKELENMEIYEKESGEKIEIL